MTLRAPALLAALLLVVTSLGACRELADLFDPGAGEAVSGSEGSETGPGGAGGAEGRRAEKARTWERGAAPTEDLDPSSAAGMLKRLVEKRLSCHADACKREVLEALDARREELLPGIPELVGGHGERVTVEVLRLAGLFEYAPAVEAIGRVAMVGSKSVRGEAVWALGAIGDRSAVPTLDRLSRLDNAPWMGTALCRALGKIGDPSGLVAMERVLGGGGVDTRVACVRAAGRTRSTEAIPLLEGALRDHSPKVVRAARAALGRLPGDEAKEALNGASRGEPALGL